MNQKVFLIGGSYGSGKTYTCRLVAEHPDNSYKTKIVDQDDLLGNNQGKIVDREGSSGLRAWVWQEGFINLIQASIAEGHDLILAPGTFKTRKDRDKYLHEIEQATRGLVDVIPLFYMLPMKDTINAVKSTRRDDTHLINFRTVHGDYAKFNRHFRVDDNSDLLLPSDRGMLAPEYHALLSHRDPATGKYSNENNVHLLHSPHEDRHNPQRRWVVVTSRFDPGHLFSLIEQDITDPIEVRSHFEQGNRYKSVEGNKPHQNGVYVPKLNGLVAVRRAEYAQTGNGHQENGTQNGNGLLGQEGVKAAVLRSNPPGFYK